MLSVSEWGGGGGASGGGGKLAAFTAAHLLRRTKGLADQPG